MAMLPLCLASNSAVAADRFVGVQANGNQIEGKQIFDWYNDKVNPRLDGHRLLDQNNPVRWLRDREAPQLTPPQAYVETICGDRLPGKVSEFRPGNQEANLTRPPHVVVEPGFEQRPARNDHNLTAKVSTGYIRRIVWEARSRDNYRPSVLFLRDGSSVRFRAVRMSSSSVSLLTEFGPQRYSFGEIAELHFPRRDAWHSHFNELAVLSTEEESRLMQVETVDGLVATSSLTRMVVLGHGGPDRYDFWVHAIQPAWSLEPLWVPCGNIAIRRFFAMNEVPLYRLAANMIGSGSAFGAEQSVQRNANVLGGIQRSADYEAGWGFGVQGAKEIVLPLHRSVRQLRGRVGLDQAVGEGGCIRAQVYVGGESTSPIWQSPHMVGSQKSVSLGTIGINPAADNNTTHKLRLTIDPAHDGRPAGSDPWEIRDLANWLDPLLVLDEGQLREQLRQRLPQQIAAWEGWQVHTQQADSLRALNEWSNLYPPMGEYRTLTQLKENQTLRLVRTIDLNHEANWLLLLAAHRSHTQPGAMIEVRIGGELAGTYEAPLLDPSHKDPPPLIIPLTEYRQNGAKQVEVEIIRHHAANPLDWRSINVLNEMPLLATLFEETGEFENVTENADPIEAQLEKADRHAGQASLKVAGRQSVQLRFAQPLTVRSNPQWGEYRYIRFAFRKKGQGRIGLQLERPNAQQRAVRYDAGQGEPVAGQANRVWTQELPDQWIVMTRDLVSEFDEFTVEGLTLTVPDGEYALFDHIYLARSRDDFELAPATISPELANQKARRELATEILKKALPAVVKLEMADGRTGTGTIIEPQGYILTTGHLLVEPNQEVKVMLADGRQLTGKSLGIDREFDLGVVKISSEEPFPQIDINTANELPEQQMYVGALYQPQAQASQEPLTHIVGVRRVVDGIIWTDFDAPEYTTGGPLFDRDAKQIGMLISRSQFGGFQYLIGEKLRKNYDRMKRSEVWGEWPSGSGPMVGVIIRTEREGCRVIEVIADSPAAAAGLQVNDYLTKVEGQEVASLGEIYQLLKAKNPGDNVKVNYRRAEQQQESTMTLTPRWP